MWVNLIIDSLASLALATEPPKIELLNRPPHGRDEYIISRTMLKQIIGIALFEIIVMYVLCFAGEYFYPEPDLYWRFDHIENPFVYPGRLYDWDGEPLWIKYEPIVGASRHMTNVFNIYVVMNIFNMINTRKISNEKNIFSGL